MAVAGVVWNMTTLGTQHTDGCIEVFASPYATDLAVEAGGIVRKYTIRRQ